MHVITTVESTDTSVTRECSCGWVTIGTLPEPDFHTPLKQREADHLRGAAAIEDGTVWQEIPAGHVYRLHLRRRLRDRTPNQVVITAVWTGGSREVLLFPWTVDGLAAAQAWCDEHPTYWMDGITLSGPVLPGSLAVHDTAWPSTP